MALAMADMTPRHRRAHPRRRAAAPTGRSSHAPGQGAQADRRRAHELPGTQLGGLSQGLSQGVGQAANLADILTEERYLLAHVRICDYSPSAKTPLRTLCRRADPSNKDKSSQFIGPNGLATELSELFTFDLGAMRRRRAAALADDEGPHKRARLEEMEDEMG